jgi:antitoxin (DNA-binding transcriptional repressor) of toxin-antitoxin stability system
MNIRSIGIGDLQKRLGSQIDALEPGDILVITRRGRPVARMVPVKLPEVPIDDRMSLFIAAGLFSWSGKKLPADIPQVTVRGPKTVAEMLIEDRD